MERALEDARLGGYGHGARVKAGGYPIFGGWGIDSKFPTTLDWMLQQSRIRKKKSKVWLTGLRICETSSTLLLPVKLNHKSGFSCEAAYLPPQWFRDLQIAHTLDG